MRKRDERRTPSDGRTRRVIGYVQGRLGGGEVQSSALAIFGGVSMDFFSDGVMIGTGTVLNPALGLLLALPRCLPTSPKASQPWPHFAELVSREGGVC